MIAATLGTGAYSIDLQPGWALERIDVSGVGTTGDATLVSPASVPFDIPANSTTSVLFQFETSGTIIGIGTGTLNVAISVTETGGAVGTCDVVLQTGCAPGEGRYLVDDQGATVCAPRRDRLAWRKLRRPNRLRGSGGLRDRGRSVGVLSALRSRCHRYAVSCGQHLLVGGRKSR